MYAFNVHRVPCRKSTAARTPPLLLNDRRTDCMLPSGHGPELCYRAAQSQACAFRTGRRVLIREACLGRSVTGIGASPSLLKAAGLRMETTAASPLTSGGSEMIGNTASQEQGINVID